MNTSWYQKGVDYVEAVFNRNSDEHSGRGWIVLALAISAWLVLGVIVWAIWSLIF